MDSHGKISRPMISQALKFATKLQPGSLNFALDVSYFSFRLRKPFFASSHEIFAMDPTYD